MLRNLVTAWSIPEVRARLVHVMTMMAVFAIGLHIPVPGVNSEALERLIQSTPLLTLFDTFSGSAFRRFTIFALGITPYINASIIMQLLTVAVPQLEALQKEGESGRKKIAQVTRYLTVGLALFQATGLITMLSNQSAGGSLPIFTGGFLTMAHVIVTLTAGTMFLMWMGESITEKGIGQGVSLMIFFSIMARLPYDIRLTLMALQGAGSVAIFQVIALVALFFATVVGIIYVTGGTRRIPIQHAKQQVGGRMQSARTTYLPFKVNTAGVMPIIFAISLLMFPATVASYFNNPMEPNSFRSQAARFIMNMTTPGQNHFASLAYAVLIILFTYFYASIAVNITDLTDNLKKGGSFIPGIRPGRPTREYLDRVLSRITIAGALFLATIGLVQYYIPMLTGISTFGLVGGTSLLIVVGVALDTMQNLEAHLTMRNYEGFIKQTSRRRANQAGIGSISLR